MYSASRQAGRVGLHLSGERISRGDWQCGLAPIPRTVYRFLTSRAFSIKLTWRSQSIESLGCAGSELSTGLARLYVFASSFF